MTSWLGHGSLRRLRIRFASCPWPDDVLTISAKVTDKRDGEGLVDCEFTCVNQAGEVIIRGDATAKLA
jgi:acyl dehydratase